MNLQTSLIIFLTLFFSVHLNAQNIDTTCIKTRYISVKPTKENSDLFTYKQKNDTNSLLYLIQNETDIYIESEDWKNLGSWSELKSKIDEPTTLNKIYNFRLSSSTPLANIYGEDSIVIEIDTNFSYANKDTIISYDTTLVYQYPPMKKYSFNSSEISGIRIKEDSVFDEELQSYSFKPVALGFCKLQKSGIEIELFWIDLLYFYKYTEEIKSFKWYEIITNQNYKGVQYKQISCLEYINNELLEYNNELLEFDKEIASNPKNGNLYYKKGQLKASHKDYQGAIKDYDKTIELKPDFADGYFDRGFAKCQINDYQGAIRDFDKHIEMYPKGSLNYYYRGWCKFVLEDKNGACSDFNKVKEYGYPELEEKLIKFCE